MIQVSIYTRESGSPEWKRYQVDSSDAAMARVKEHDTISAYATYEDTGGFVFNFSCERFRLSQRAKVEALQ